jgi:hypothetical protein
VFALLPVVELVYQDESGSSAALTIRLDASSTVAAAVIASAALAAVVAPITGAVLVRQRIKYEMRPEAPSLAELGSSIKRQGAFFFDCGSDIPLALVLVPGIRDAILVTTGFDAGISIDVSLTAVTTFVAALLDNGMTNPFGDAASSLSVAYRQSRVT